MEANCTDSIFTHILFELPDSFADVRNATCHYETFNFTNSTFWWYSNFLPQQPVCGFQSDWRGRRLGYAWPQVYTSFLTVIC